MNRRFHKGALFVPLLYIIIIASLVFLQFSGGGIFTENLGQITLSGTLDLSRGLENPPIASVVVEYRGLQFIFNNKSPLIIERSHSTDMQFSIAGYRQSGNALVVYFDQGVELIFNHDNNQMVITNRIPETVDNPTSLRIPFMLGTGSRAEYPENFSGLNIESARDRYILTLPPQSYVDFEKNLINIPEDGLDRSIRYTRRSSGNEAISDLWFENQLEELSTEQYQTEVSDYIDRAYLAWRSNRYNPATGTWLMGEENAQFSENILISLLSEAWLRNEYTRVFNEMRTAADIHPAELTYRSSVFLGDLRKITNDLEAEERQVNIQINNMINQNNAEVFLRPSLFQYAGDQGDEGLLSALLSFTERLIPSALSPVEALGLCMNYYLGSFPDDEVRQTLSRFESLVEEKLLPSLGRVDEGVFFLTEPGIADSYYSIVAGLVIMQAGINNQNDQFIMLGQNLIVSVLRLSDQLAFLPSQIELTAGAISATMGNLPPEELYHLITDNPYYPRHISLTNFLGSGTWAYAILSDYEIISNPSEFTLSFVNTPARTHYMFFREISDIDALNGMELFGIIWRNAPNFEIYSKGRYYNADSKTLMIKFFDDDVQQDIRLFIR